MKPRANRSSGFVTDGGECALSRPALIGLLQAVLDRGMPFRFRAPGFSMFPFVRDGDVVTLSRLPGDSPALGQVVAFVHPETGKLTLHRVIGKRGDSCLIKGDNSPDADGLVPKASVLGYVTNVGRHGKKVFLGLGPERFLIACLSRRGLLLPSLSLVWKLARPIMRREAT